jgi:hypothetical protein
MCGANRRAPGKRLILFPSWPKLAQVGQVANLDQRLRFQAFRAKKAEGGQLRLSQPLGTNATAYIVVVMFGARTVTA